MCHFCKSLYKQLCQTAFMTLTSYSEEIILTNKKNTKISSPPSSCHKAGKVFLELVFQTKEVELKKSISFENQVKVNNIADYEIKN